jgi:hypothetical protein
MPYLTDLWGRSTAKTHEQHSGQRESGSRVRAYLFIRVLSVLGSLTLAVVAACSTSERSISLVSDGGIDNRLSWESMNATIAEGSVLLISPDGLDVSQIRQKLTDLMPNTEYRVSVKARALNTPTSQLSIDLFIDETYDSPDQELIVPADELEPVYRIYHRTINSGVFREQPYLRIFTFSTVPVEVEEVTVVEASG